MDVHEANAAPGELPVFDERFQGFPVRPQRLTPAAAGRTGTASGTDMRESLR